MVIGALCAGCIAANASAAPDVKAARAFVDSTVAGAIDLLGDRALGKAERLARFRKLINGAFDMSGIERYVCGPYWDRASDAEKQRFHAAFAEAQVRTYLDRLSDYSGESVEVIDTASDGAAVVVTTTIAGPGGADGRSVDWRVVEAGKTVKLFDVVIDGVSTTETTKQDYNAVLEQDGGVLDVLTAKLRGERP